MTDIRYKDVTCNRCGNTHQCTPSFDFYVTPLWKNGERVCETCFRDLVALDHPQVQWR